MKTLRLLGAAASALTLAACAVGPTYHAPVEAPVAIGDATPAIVSATPPEPTWWRQFGDPELDALVEKALAANLDIAQAVARLDQARAMFSGAKLDLFPHVTADGSYLRGREQQPPFTATPLTLEQASLGFDAAWEVDLWGRVRHQVEGARADRDAEAEDLEAMRISIGAEVARYYLQLRGAQARRVVAEANAQTQQETLRLTKIRNGIGYEDPVDVQSAQARLSATQALIPPLRAEEMRDAQRLAVLTGQRPGTLDAELSAAPAAQPGHATVLAVGDVSALLRNRPDVRAAERRVAAETARTGAATADLFPKVNVTGFVGFLSGDVGSLFRPSGNAWAVSPAVSWPAFDIGSNLARLRAQKAKGAESLAAYEQTALAAIEDLQDAVTTYKERQEEVARLAEQVDAARKGASLARARFKEGDIDFLRVLDADRTRLEAEDALTVAQTAANTDVVAVYKALGG